MSDKNTTWLDVTTRGIDTIARSSEQLGYVNGYVAATLDVLRFMREHPDASHLDIAMAAAAQCEAKIPNPRQA